MKSYEEYVDNQLGNWEVEINDSTDSWWDYKTDAVERVLELIEDEKKLDGYIFDGEEMDKEELRYLLEDMPEEDFYTTLEDIKKYADITDDIRIYNISDEDEIDFLKDTDSFNFDFD